MTKLLLAITFVLAGCAHNSPIKDISIDSGLLKLCDQVEELTMDSDVGIEYIHLLEKYGRCAALQKASVSAFKNISGNNK